MRGLVNEPGTDGTVRLAGCALNTRKIIVDLTKDPRLTRASERITFQPWTNVDIPLILVAGVNHGTIISEPPEELVERVDQALRVGTAPEYLGWLSRSTERTSGALKPRRDRGGERGRAGGRRGRAPPPRSAGVASRPQGIIPNDPRPRRRTEF